MQRLFRGVDPLVFWGAVGLSTAFVLWGVLGTDSLSSVMGSVLDWVIRNFGWGFVLIAIGALVFCIVVAVSPVGRVRLGPDDSRPEFSTVSWVAMMFAAGLGLGLMFYGVAEPISHFSAPPHGLAEPRSQEAELLALETTYFHWGFNGWAIYAVMGLALAYFTFRKGTPNLVSATFTPLLGDRASETPLGRTIDSLAIFATLFGTATSLGLGALQINSGLNFLWDVTVSNTVGVVIIIVITALFVLSAVSGVERGIQFLSNLSGGATIALMVFFLVVGPTVFIIGTAIESIGGYVIHLCRDELPHGDVRRPGVDGGLDDLLLGMVDLLGAVRRHVRRPHLARPDDPGVPRGRDRDADRDGLSLVRDRRLDGNPPADERAGRPRRDHRDARAVPLHGARAAAAHDDHFDSLADPDRVLLHQRRRCRVDRDGDDGLAREARAGPARDRDFGCLMGAIACALLLVGGLSALQQGAVLASVPFTFVIVGLAWSLTKALREERQPAHVPLAAALVPETPTKGAS